MTVIAIIIKYMVHVQDKLFISIQGRAKNNWMFIDIQKYWSIESQKNTEASFSYFQRSQTLLNFTQSPVRDAQPNKKLNVDIIIVNYQKQAILETIIASQGHETQKTTA